MLKIVLRVDNTKTENSIQKYFYFVMQKSELPTLYVTDIQ